MPIRKRMMMKIFKRMRMVIRKWKMIRMVIVMLKGIINRMMVMKIRMVTRFIYLIYLFSRSQNLIQHEQKLLIKL